ncbi:hypothetical protein IVB33_30245 [Bradyrhizobium sp. 24]|uniref:hypothetical protein n=1 Tax=unclassified Bradyrhizobium TaxID=2631580 RepID=UPI001FFB8AD0|nr:MULTISPECIES: hypothetical protein [unclassified Bradyrhizobium]MCK1297521.1 hypothetical protein [Bradyrhizobium sp. 37]MCK1381174.1 hypothetical protein [Bradyrhizobium sp. 24]MCK1770925.1 hypothetical protein [Bradyrhizobium sp. 134]
MPPITDGIWSSIIKIQTKFEYPIHQTEHERDIDLIQSVHASSIPFKQRFPASRSLQLVIAGYARLVSDRMEDEWSAYLVTFVFDHLRGPRASVLGQMRDEILRIYSTFVTRTHRKPRAVPPDQLPVLIAVADLPVAKSAPSNEPTSCNGGLHFHAVLLVPPTTRLKEPVTEHFKNQANLYAGPRKLVARIHVQPITATPECVADYVFKSVLRGRISYDDSLLVLPRASGELH